MFFFQNFFSRNFINAIEHYFLKVNGSFESDTGGREGFNKESGEGTHRVRKQKP
jgi:hypothetical protein